MFNNPVFIDVKLYVICLLILFVGVLSDVDGDGTIDLVTTVHMEAKLRCGDYTLSKIQTYVMKINLAEVMHKKEFMPIGPVVPPEDRIGHKIASHAKDIMEVKFASLDTQPWRQYMGSESDNIYRRPPLKAVPSSATRFSLSATCSLFSILFSSHIFSLFHSIFSLRH